MAAVVRAREAVDARDPVGLAERRLQRELGLLAGRDVGDDAVDHDPAVAAAARPLVHLDPPHPAVAADQPVLGIDRLPLRRIGSSRPS